MRTPAMILISLCCVTVGGCISHRNRVGSDSVKSRLFTVRYVTRVENIPNSSAELRLWIPLPRNSLHQRITELKVAAPLKYRITAEKTYGNKMVFLSLSNPPSQVEVEMLFHVRRFENSAQGGRDMDVGMKGVALQSNRLIPLSPAIRKMAKGIAEGKKSSRDRARAFYDHVIEQMTYDKTGTGWGRGDFQYACRVYKGNCTDYHAYFIGLCRNIGIPAYSEIGLSIPVKPAEGETGGYHCWAYFWEGSHWIPVDISEADKHPERKEYFFGNHCENRVAFGIGRDIVLEPRQNGKPLNFFIYPYAEVDGRPHADVKKYSYYRNLEEKGLR